MTVRIPGITATTPQGIYEELAAGFEAKHPRRRAPGRTIWPKGTSKKTRDLNSYLFYAYIMDRVPGYQSNGCSASMDWDFGWACDIHDLLYAYGGNERDRRNADHWLADTIRWIGREKVDRADGPVHALRLKVRYKWFETTRRRTLLLFGWQAFNYRET